MSRFPRNSKEKLTELGGQNKCPCSWQVLQSGICYAKHALSTSTGVSVSLSSHQPPANAAYFWPQTFDHVLWCLPWKRQHLFCRDNFYSWVDNGDRHWLVLHSRLHDVCCDSESCSVVGSADRGCKITTQINIISDKLLK